MATGDILSAVVRADGWSMDVTIEGFAVGATYDFGSLGNTPPTVTTPKFSVAVVSEGYNASGVLGTINRTVYGTHVVRKAYPNQASKDETVSGSNIVVRVALSESIYADDKNGGAGTSGTNPTVTVSAGWATNTGGGAQSSAAVTAGAVTNSSTLAYPKCIAQWAWGHTPAFRRVAAAFSIGCLAYHGHGIACVALSATDAHAAAVSGTAATKTDHAMSASGLHYESYDLAVPVTSFTDGDDITLRFIAYPLVGDAASIIDTSTDTTTANIAKGLTKITCTYKTTGLTTKYVGTTGTNDTAAGRGDTSGNPYLTIGYALSKNPDIVIVKAGTYDLLGSTPASVAAKSYCIEVMPDTGASVTLNRNGPTGYDFKARHLRYSGLTIASAGEAYSLESTAAYTLQFGDVTFTRTGALPGQGVGAETDATLFVNCTWNGREFFGTNAVYNNSMVGCSVLGGEFRTFHGVVACKLEGTGTADQMILTDRLAGLQQSNFLMLNNRMIKLRLSGSPGIKFGSAFNVIGAAFIGNIVECITTNASGPQLFSWFESSPSYTSDSTILAHNTIIGQRCNCYYNDNGVAAVLQKNAFVKNNAFESWNIKADTFATENANRVGNWSVVNGVNFSDNRFDGTAGFPCDWDGINVAYVTGENQTFGQMGYTDDNSSDGDATGNGDYMPTEASVLYDHTLRQAYQSYDLYGVAL